MDIRVVGSKLLDCGKKYRYAILVLVIGLGLMMLPGKTDEESTVTQPVNESVSFDDPTEELTRILSQIKGAGKVQLLLTLSAGEKTLYQTDQDTSGESIQLETVIVTGSDRSEQGLIQQITAPEYRGAVIVCQGAEDAAVRLAIVEAVSNATGLGTDRISVLKMK